MPIIVREDLRNSKFLSTLNFDATQMKFSSSIQPNFIFESFPSSLALFIAFIKEEDENSLSRALQEMTNIQRGFRNCYTIVVTKNEKCWIDVNLNLTGGLMRLHWAVDQISCLELVRAIYGDMCTPEAHIKLKAQHTFFDNEKDQLCSEKTALQCYQTSLQYLDVNSPYDVSILVDGFPSIKKLVSTDLSTFQKNSPASNQALERIAGFFHGIE